MRRMIALPLTALALLAGLAACSSPPAAVEVGDDTIVLDVRTAEEYAGGHLEGARLLDFNGGDVAAAIPDLDPDAEYVVYCRSGNRSGQAVALMQRAGFGNVTDLGSLEQAASATAIDVVTD